VREHLAQAGVGDPVEPAGGAPAGARERQRRAERVHVGGRVDRGAGQLFRRREPPGSGRVAVGADAGRAQPGGDAEVDQPRPVGGEQHVRRFHVAVRDARAVHGGEGLGETRGQCVRRVDRQRAVLLDGVAQGHRGQELRGQPGDRGVRTGVDNRGTVPAGGCSGGPHLAPEPLPVERFGGEIGVHHLDRDGPPSGRAGEVHDGHPARAEPGAEAVPPDGAGVVALKGPHCGPHRVRPARSGR
jgi:hypothetical protein